MVMIYVLMVPIVIVVRIWFVRPLYFDFLYRFMVKRRSQYLLFNTNVSLDLIYGLLKTLRNFCKWDQIKCLIDNLKNMEFVYLLSNNVGTL